MEIVFLLYLNTMKYANEMFILRYYLYLLHTWCWSYEYIMEKPQMVGNRISQWSERYVWSRPSTRTSLCADNSICLRRCKTQRTVIIKFNSIGDLLKYWRLAGTSSTVLSGRGHTQRYVTGCAWTPLNHTLTEFVNTLSLQHEYIFFDNPISWCFSFMECCIIPLLYFQKSTRNRYFIAQPYKTSRAYFWS